MSMFNASNHATMTNYNIDNHKLHLHPERVSDYLSGKSIYPLYVEVSPVGYCNHRCVFCALDFMGYKASKLDTKRLLDVISDMALSGVKSVMFAGEGEPLLHPDIVTLVRHANASGLDVAVTTNGVALTPDKLDLLRYCKWIKFSVDAGDALTYARVHGCNARQWGDLWQNIGHAIDYKKDNNLSVVLGAQALAITESLNSLSRLEIFCKTFELDYLVVKQYSKHSSSINSLESCKVDSTLFDSSYTLVRHDALERNYSTCHATPHFWAYVSASGDIYGCSDKIGQDSFVYGNVNTDSFTTIWNGVRRKFAIQHMTAYSVDNCRPGCRMDSCNRYLEELKSPRDHINFI